MSWQSLQVCEECYELLWYRNRVASRLKEEFRVTTPCGMCQQPTRSGIYNRIQTSHLPIQRSEEP